MDNPNIPPQDQERIDLLVSEFRHRMENLYRLAHIQGQIESETAARDALRRKVAA